MCERDSSPRQRHLCYRYTTARYCRHSTATCCASTIVSVKPGQSSSTSRGSSSSRPLSPSAVVARRRRVSRRALPASPMKPVSRGWPMCASDASTSRRDPSRSAVSAVGSAWSSSVHAHIRSIAGRMAGPSSTRTAWSRCRAATKRVVAAAGAGRESASSGA
eukprot:4006579-Prymnesium_polylepis.1